MTEQLVERIRNHDQRAMGQLYQKYVGMLSSVCYRYVPAEDDAKDVLQNSFIMLNYIVLILFMMLIKLEKQRIILFQLRLIR